jgi:hypothetical protein
VAPSVNLLDDGEVFAYFVDIESQLQKLRVHFKRQYQARVDMKALVLVSWMMLLYSPLLWTQTLFVVGKGGISSYGSVYIGNFGGGGGDQNWKPGPIVGLGMRVRTGDGFAVDGLVEYSIHSYATELSEPIANDPKNSIFEFTATGRLSFGIVEAMYIDIIGGVGISSQHEDEVVTIYQNSQYTSPGKESVDFGAVLGVGVEARISKKIELLLEGSLRMRTYVTPVVQLGIAYAL